MFVSEIANKLGLEMAGTDQEVTGISFFDEAPENSIAVTCNKDEIRNTKARVVLSKPVILPIDKTFLFTYENLELAIVDICSFMIKEHLLSDYSIPDRYTLHKEGYYLGDNCIISGSACIQPGAMIGSGVSIGDNCIIESYANIGAGTVLEKDVCVGSGTKIGSPSFFHYYDKNGQLKQFQGCGTTIIKENTHIGSNTVIQRGTISNTIIEKNCMIGNHIDIGHDVKIGKGCKIVSQTGIAGGAVLKDNVLVYGQVGIANGVVIGNNSIVKGRTVVSKSVKDNMTVYGPFGRNYYDEIRLIAKIRRYFDRKEE